MRAPIAAQGSALLAIGVGLLFSRAREKKEIAGVAQSGRSKAYGGSLGTRRQFLLYPSSRCVARTSITRSSSALRQATYSQTPRGCNYRGRMVAGRITNGSYAPRALVAGQAVVPNFTILVLRCPIAQIALDFDTLSHATRRALVHAGQRSKWDAGTRATGTERMSRSSIRSRATLRRRGGLRVALRWKRELRENDVGFV